jgi:hypothetical protein
VEQGISVPEPDNEEPGYNPPPPRDDSQ